ncbi:MAG: GNAT family N-acetyltransferase [Oscillospiraceae bacterium]|nr:GNAT family N-acetyltransferase [Oscillospiraceae bacterium]
MSAAGIERVRIREAEPGEELFRELIRLSEDWEAEGSCYGYRRNGRADLEGRRVFVAELDGAILGYLFGVSERAEKMRSIMPDGTPFFEIEELYVAPAYRSRGLGGRLFRGAEEALRDGGAAYLLLSTASRNWRAVLHFYIDEMEMSFWSARLFKKL